MTQARRIASPPESGGARRPGGRVPWRAAGAGLTSLGIGVADHQLGQITLAIELLAVLAVIGTGLEPQWNGHGR